MRSSHTSVRIGLLGLTRDPLPRLRELALLAEAVGYDDLWLADERFFRDVYVSLTVAATQTHRIRLGPCVTDPYSRHPALTAMAIASLAEAYPGRVALGIGAGISGFAELGIARIKPARAIREAVEVIRLLLAGDVADSDGEVIRVTRARLGFAPPPSVIPIYVASNGRLGQQAAGAVADAAIMEGCATPDEARVFAEEVARGARLAGRDPSRISLVARLDACLSADVRPHGTRCARRSRGLWRQGACAMPPSKPRASRCPPKPGPASRTWGTSRASRRIVICYLSSRIGSSTP